MVLGQLCPVRTAPEKVSAQPLELLARHHPDSVHLCLARPPHDEPLEPLRSHQRITERVEERPTPLLTQHVGHEPLRLRAARADALEQKHHPLKLQVRRRHLQLEPRVHKVRVAPRELHGRPCWRWGARAGPSPKTKQEEHRKGFALQCPQREREQQPRKQQLVESLEDHPVKRHNAGRRVQLHLQTAR